MLAVLAARIAGARHRAQHKFRPLVVQRLARNRECPARLLLGLRFHGTQNVETPRIIGNPLRNTVRGTFLHYLFQVFGEWLPIPRIQQLRSQFHNFHHQIVRVLQVQFQRWFQAVLIVQVRVLPS